MINFSAWIVLAQEGGGSILTSIWPTILAMGFLFYFLMIRPEKRKRQEQTRMLDEMKKNDRIVTIGGIKGVITNIQRDADEVTIKVDEGSGTKLRVQISAISRVVTDDDDKKNGDKK